MRQVSLFTAGLCAFLYGVAVGHYQLFPFDQIQEGISWIRTGKSSPRLLARHRIAANERAQSNVVLLGDSITAGGDWTRLLPGIALANHGVGGDFVSDVRNRLKLTLDQKPKLVFLMVGTNDVIRGTHQPTMLQNYRELLSRLDEANIKIIAQSLLLTSRADFNATIIATNQTIAEMCSAVPRCQYFDLNGAIAPLGALELTDDGVHPNAPAYELWARAIEPIVRQYR